MSIGTANVPIVRLQSPHQGPGREIWASSGHVVFSSERLLIMDPRISMVCPIPTVAFLWPTWHPSWKDIDPLLLWVSTGLSCPHPLSQDYTDTFKAFFSLKKVIIFGLEVRCRNYWGSHSHSLPCPWFSWLWEEAMGLNVFLALTSKQMGEGGIQCVFSSLTRHIKRPFWILLGGGGVDMLLGRINTCQDCQES